MPPSNSCRTCGRRSGQEPYCKRHMKLPKKPPAEFRRRRDARFKIDDGACWLCGSARLLEGERWSGDHVVPQSMGGGHELANLRRAHELCNSRRGSRIATTALLAELRRRRAQDELAEG